MNRLIKNKPWGKGLKHWIVDNRVYISVVFTWLIDKAWDLKDKYEGKGYEVSIGGPAIRLVFNRHDCYNNALYHHNPDACFTTRGCIRSCKFCAVPKIEGDFEEIDNFDPKPIVCDNNFLASSKQHFEEAINRLKNINDIDFNQGLDARLLTRYHINHLCKLKLKCVRFAWDNIKEENRVMDAINLCIKNGIPKSKIRIYVLIGFRDTPEDAYYRLSTLQRMRVLPFPMRYQPLNCSKKNSCIEDGWTDDQLKKYVKYFSNLRITNKIPFDEFVINRKIGEKEN